MYSFITSAGEPWRSANGKRQIYTKGDIEKLRKKLRENWNAVIEKILRHCGLWIERQQRGPPNRERVLVEVDSL